MEELQEALKGKNENSLICVLHESVESLAHDYLNQDVVLDRNQSSFENVIIMSPNNKNKDSIEELSLNNYLSLRRHSIGSLIELRAGQRSLECRRVAKHYSSPNLNERDYLSYTGNDERDVDYRFFDSFMLSPIEEYSETSTTNSFRESSEYSKETGNTLSLFSCSCSLLTTRTEDIATKIQKYQTFPRSKTERSLTTYATTEPSNKTLNLGEASKFPLTPREIDPLAYYQLHTADSQEELQEFLLLESACMSDNKGPGLAAAFSKKKCH